MNSSVVKLFIWVTCLSMAACQSMYFDAMEKVGIHKRDILVDRVEDARDSQLDAKETFKSSLARFQSVLNVEETDLQEKYDIMEAEFNEANDSANKVTERIESIKDVAEALFEEWNEELGQYSNAKLKRQSQQKLNDTQSKYTRLMKSMRRAENKMQPVLAALKDQVLFLKHNLNAQAIDAMKGELTDIQSNVSRLIKDMEKSINESEEFIAQLEK